MKPGHGLLFLVVVCAVLSVTACSPSGTSSNQAAMAGINKLHQDDIAATLNQNADQLAALWADDGVLLSQGNAPVIGKQTIREGASHSVGKIVSYTPRIQDVSITGDSAVEWGYFDVTFQDPSQPQTGEFHGRFLRAMKKQQDGTWKFTRVMWQQAE
jgi:uncharacterized protein (TIGR02246 family)